MWLNVEQLQRLSDKGLNATWTTDEQSWSIKAFESAEERWAWFARNALHLWWVIPADGSLTHFDRNFRITSLEQQGDSTVVAFTLADTPRDRYWQQMRERLKLTVQQKTGVISAARVTMAGPRRTRDISITAQHTFEPVPAETFAIPAKIAAQIKAE